MLRPFTRSFYISFFILAALGNSFSQSTDKNFLLVRTYKLPRTTVSDNIKDASQDVSYIDGLGRPLQSISAHASPQLSGSTPNDLVSHTEYDAYGRVSKVYAPSPMTGNGGYHSGTDVGTASTNYYENPSNFNEANNRGYTLTEYEASPLNRVRKQFAVGSDRSVDFSYGVNGSNEIKRYDVSGNNLTENGTYGANQLTFVQTLDENGNETKEFKDKNGRVILKATDAGNGDWLNTYYVYDDLSQLRFVLQPQYQTNGATTDQYAFKYQYNEKGLISSKYVPGGGTTYLFYDERDRLKESTDGRGRTTYFKYDDLNRIIETGEKNGSENALVKTHYDNYSPSFGVAAGFSNELGDYPSGNRSNVKGKVTFTATRVLYADGNYNANDAWMYTTMYYDDRLNVIQTIRSLYDIGGTSFERTTRQLRFDGRVEKELILQSVGTGNHSVEKVYSYDHADRPLSTRYVVRSDNDTKKDIVLSANRYNALGQLKTKFLHSPSDDKFREQLDYSYVPRSWMSKVTGKTSVGDNFGVELKYGNPSQAELQFNGNIAEMLWRQGSGGWVGYKFAYDKANRLKNAEGLKNVHGLFNYNFRESISEYDKNGNIKHLERYDGSDTWDNLTYDYIGNQLSKVTDSGNGNGFNNGSSGGGDDYLYDGAGNATKDANRGIGDNGIAYNFLNLPRQIGINGNTLQYFYDGSGNKLRMQNSNANTKYAGAFEYNYQNYLTRIATEEGQITVINNGAAAGDYAFEYYLKDHLGNTRMVMNEAGTMVQETEYFAFGLAIPKMAGSNKYLYNGKEKQPETGLLDYGARQYDPSIGRWITVDPKAELLESASSFTYSLNSPMVYVDKDGQLPILINGRVSANSERANKSYWDSQLLATIKNSGIPNPGGDMFFVDGDQYATFFYGRSYVQKGVDLESGTNSTDQRHNAGYETAKRDFASIMDKLERDPKSGKIIEKIQIYTHSRGAAFGTGYTEALLELIGKNAGQFSDASNVIDLIVNMAPHQSGSIPIHASIKNSFSMHDQGDVLSGNNMKGQRGRFSFDSVKGTGESHRNKTFTNALGTFLKEFQNGANNDVVNDFVKKMKSQYGVDVTVN